MTGRRDVSKGGEERREGERRNTGRERNEGEADRGDPLTGFCVVDLCVEVSWVLPASIVARLLK